jgi:hypothetical protein
MSMNTCPAPPPEWDHTAPAQAIRSNAHRSNAGGKVTDNISTTVQCAVVHATALLNLLPQHCWQSVGGKDANVPPRPSKKLARAFAEK